MTKYVLAALILFAIAVSAAGQDIRGLEVCTAEKSMERRTGCLQSNVQFLQQAAVKQAREMQAKLEHELAELKKPKPEKK